MKNTNANQSNQTNRRRFMGRAGGAGLFILAGSRSFADENNRGSGEFVFLEAEQFTEHGGWDLDQQSMDRWDRLTCWRMDWGLLSKMR
ncbi:hypothetical protein [Novipirellula aureliae]|uniref:hypothetical protein n=1 Tax=Novipirellula aureliae TaxID=2527966 RepID=UPI0018CE5CFE|nr:hypothetical protein [Novipirellula aureliae]